MDTLLTTVRSNGLVVAFAVVGLTVWVSNLIATKFTGGRIHGSAIAITLGLVAAYVGGKYTGGGAGVADVSLLAGIGIMGGGMFRDFAIVATAFGVRVSELKKAGTAVESRLLPGFWCRLSWAPPSRCCSATRTLSPSRRSALER